MREFLAIAVLIIIMLIILSKTKKQKSTRNKLDPFKNVRFWN